MNGTIVVVGLVFFLVGIYIATYLLNSNTERPDGIKELPKCTTCHSSGACAIKNDSIIDQESCEIEQNKTTTEW
jgi:hypothetical protein